MGYNIKKERPYRERIFEEIPEGVGRNEVCGYLDGQSGQRENQGQRHWQERASPVSKSSRKIVCREQSEQGR